YYALPGSPAFAAGTYYIYSIADEDLVRKARISVLNQLTGVGQASSGIEDKPSQTREEKAAGKAATSLIGAGLSAEYGRFTLNGVSGKNYSLPLSTSFTLNDRIGLNVGVPLIYTEIGSATAYGVGLSAGLPVKLLKQKEDRGFSWQLTPSFGGTGTACKELATGGVILNGGMTSLASYDFGKFAVSMGNHMSTYESTNAKFDGYKYETRFSQKVIKNGLKFDVPVSLRWVVDAYTVHNKVSGSDVMDHYMTYGVDLAYRVIGNDKKATSRLGFVSLGVKTDQGSGYRATNFQIGSGWSF
ncbi:MAG: hypothetical protein WCL08_14180, partial [Verrucomicrobiota bacterium]